MDRWHGTGTWARFFDNPTAKEIQLDDWQVIDLAGAKDHDDLTEAALFYLLERLRISIDDPAQVDRVKLMVVDEAWKYLQDPRRPQLPGRSGKDLAQAQPPPSSSPPSPPST